MADLSKTENNTNNIPFSTPDTLTENKDILYNCTECSSLIEILSINEDRNLIEFKCLNKDCGIEETKLLNEYFEQMENISKDM